LRVMVLILHSMKFSYIMYQVLGQYKNMIFFYSLTVRTETFDS